MEMLQCPLTLYVFRDPVIGSDGHTYERESITEWLRLSGTSPLTNEPMSIESLRPNYIVRQLVEQFTEDPNKKEYRFRLDVDLRKTETRPLFQTFSKSIYKAEWINRSGSPIVLMKIEGAKANREASFYAKLSWHPHIVRTYGLVESDPNCVMLIQEYAQKGDLAELLRENNFRPTIEVLIEIFLQIVDAMIFLADKNIVHGDLACRNVLVCQCEPNDINKNLVKLSDFGLTKESNLFSVTTSSSQIMMTEIPIRYAAPELIQNDKEQMNYSEKSDVYSFGTLMWEACSYGSLPFSSISDDNEVRHLKLYGDLLPQPPICDQILWQIIVVCWEREPAKRPTFKALKEMLSPLSVKSKPK